MMPPLIVPQMPCVSCGTLSILQCPTCGHCRERAGCCVCGTRPATTPPTNGKVKRRWIEPTLTPLAPDSPLVQRTNLPALLAYADTLRGALDDTLVMLKRFIWRPNAWEYDALALWTLHTHAIAAFDWSPLLSITSPDGGYGKTRTLLVLKGLARNGLYREKITASAAKRELESAHDQSQTLALLLDQVRGHSYEWEDLLDIGVRRGATIVSNVKPSDGADFEPREYHVFGPKAIGSIAGHEALSGTNDSRAVSLPYREKGGDKVAEAYPYDGTAPADVVALRNRLTAIMTLPMLQALRKHETRLKPGRRNDTYRPLVTLGDMAGEPWSSRARDLLGHHESSRRASRFVEVLTDLVEVCEGLEDSAFLPSTEAVRKLIELEESPWREQRLSTKGLATLLKEWAIQSARDSGHKLRGYTVGHIRRAFQRQAEG